MVLYSPHPESEKVGSRLKDTNLLESFFKAGLADEVVVLNSDQIKRLYKFTPLEPQRKILLGIGFPVNSFCF